MTIVGLASTGIACTSDDETAEPAAPQITDAADDPELSQSLISLEEVESAPGAPEGLVEQPVQDSALYENPDPRGPCGAQVIQPAFKDAAIAAFGTTQPPQATLVNAVWDLPAREAAAFLAATKEDIKPNCPPFVSRTPFGQQRVEFLGEIPLIDLADDAVATRSRIILKDQPTLYAGAALVRADTRLSIVIVFSEDPVRAQFIQVVANLAAAKL
ncbi:MAG: hypothetical protein ABR505_12360 [Actinomycetota bacterium]